MKYLAIDTSGKALTIVINIDGKYQTFFDAECGINHSINLMPRLEELVEKSGVKFAELDFIASVVGAGSFTGIRIGVSTVKALCLAYNLPAVSITSFDTIAYNVDEEKVFAIIDAGHGGVYACGYEKGKVKVSPHYTLINQLKEECENYTLASFQPVADLDVKVVSTLDGLIKAVEDKKDQLVYDLDNLEPLYVRKSQAEEGRK